MKNIILCDIDGTVANNDHRQHFLEGKKDWEGFFSELSNDLPITSVIEKINDHHKDGHEIVFLTGRPQRYRYSTTLWLSEYFNFDFRLLMRPDNDQKNKIEVKRKIFLEELSAEKILYVYENDLELISMWKEFNLNTVDVNLAY
tara:strand:+ start:702 stop:1133 length:432 start_codon:yes stop_codon:yes gene_type:complete